MDLDMMESALVSVLPLMLAGQRCPIYKLHCRWSRENAFGKAVMILGDTLVLIVLRVVLFYAITAILTLFRNILHNPLDPEINHLMNILREVPDLMRRIPIRKLTLGEVIHLRFLDGFTTGLVRLCECAITKARRDEIQNVNI